MASSANNVYNFIKECLNYIKDSTTKPTTNPTDNDIKEIDGSFTLPTIDVTDVVKTKETLTALLLIIGYDNKNAPVFIKDLDDPKANKIFYAINIDTGNAWKINKHPEDGAPTLYGGRKRKTNRRKHRRANRKTLGRKK